MDRQVRLLLEAVRPWDSGRRYLNFAESRMDPRSIYPVESYERLRQAKARYDPAGMFLANHPVDASRVTHDQVKALTARARIRPTTMNETSACEPMATFAQCASGIVSVGLNALAVVNPTYR